MSKHELRYKLIKALAHPDRLAIVDLLAEKGETCVCDIAVAVGMSQPMASRYLGMLRESGLLESRKEGLMVFYRLSAPCLAGFFNCIDNVLRRQLETRQVLINEEEQHEK